MSDAALMRGLAPRRGPNLDTKPHASVGVLFIGLLVAGLAYTFRSVVGDIEGAGGRRSPPGCSCCWASPC